MEELQARLENTLAGVSLLAEAVEETGMLIVCKMPGGQALVQCGTGSGKWAAVSRPVGGADLEEWLAEVSHAAKEATAAHAECPDVDQSALCQVLSQAILKLVGARTERPQQSSELYKKLADATSPGGILGGGGNIEDVSKGEAEHGKA